MNDYIPKTEKKIFIHRVWTSIKSLFRRIKELFANLFQQEYFYESKRKILGLPLLSINLGPPDSYGNLRCARGIVAIGTKAIGLIALGVYSVKGIFSVGFLGIGIITISVAGVGIVSVSAFGLGIISIGIFAFGYIAVGILSIGIKSIGIFAVGSEAVGLMGIGEKEKFLFPFKK